MPSPATRISRSTVGDEVTLLLRTIMENTRLSRSNKLADVKMALEPSVSIEFDTYFFFLRKYHYIAMDREAQLKVTERGEKLLDGESGERFISEVTDFFAGHLALPSQGADLAASPGATSADEDAPPPPLPGPFHAKASRRSTPPEDAAPPVSTPGFTELRRDGSGPTKGTDIDLRYVKFDAIGSGPLGTVYKGRHNALALDVCVKELKDIFGYFSFLQRSEVIKRLKKELCAQAQVRHPSVIAILDQNTDVARPYFVMELHKGSLREKLDRSGGKGLDVRLTIRYFLQLCYGLKSAHDAGLTHHNLKPENVLFDAFGNAKLGDFGLSRVIEVDQARGMPQVFVGTGGMGYMAPELIARAKDLGPAADVYALGILLYEMLTGTLPGRRSPLPSEANSEVPVKLDAIFDKMTEDRRDTRYADCDTLLDDFYKAFADGEYLEKGDLLLWSALEPTP